MNNLNSVIIEGNLTRDPSLEKVANGKMVCNFPLASHRFYKTEAGRQQEVNFIDVEVWSRLAETCGEFLEKGRGVRVVGRLKQDRWSDGEGRNRSRIKIVGEHVEFKPKSKADDQPSAATENTSEQKPAAEDIPAY